VFGFFAHVAGFVYFFTTLWGFAHAIDWLLFLGSIVMVSGFPILLNQSSG
jgi:hypothetical protein